MIGPFWLLKIKGFLSHQCLEAKSISACQRSSLPPVHTIDHVRKNTNTRHIYQHSCRLLKFPPSITALDFFRIAFFANRSLARSSPVSLKCLISGIRAFVRVLGAGRSDNKCPHLRSRLRGAGPPQRSAGSEFSRECRQPWMGLIGQVCSDGNEAGWRTLQLASPVCSKVITNGKLWLMCVCVCVIVM